MTNNNLQDERELLEPAAKAAGLNVRWNQSYCKGTGQWERDVRPAEPPLSEWLPWNPLTDDGDALRLAVKLQLQITPGTYNKDEFSAFHAGCGEAHEFWSTLQDEFAATRRAIVRAAAEIGRSMK